MEKIKKYALLPVFFGLPFLLHPINNLFLRATGTPVSKLYDINHEYVFFFVLIAIAGFLLYRFLLSDLQKDKFFSWSKFSLALFFVIFSTYLRFFPFEYPIVFFEGKSHTLLSMILNPISWIIKALFNPIFEINRLEKCAIAILITLIFFLPFYLLGWLVFKGLQKIRFSQKTLHITILIFFIILCIIANPEFILRGIEL